MNKFKTIFLGTPDFSLSCLELLHNHPHIELTLVISMPDRPSGRGQEMKSPEVIEYAKINKIPYFQTANINNEEELIKNLYEQKIDLCVVLAFAQFLSEKILSLPQIGCFNIHTSLLPKYRGAAPIQYAIWNDDKKTGVSIQKMVKKMDAGDLVMEKSLDILSNETGGMLNSRLKELTGVALSEFIEKVANNNITYSKQNEADVSFAPTLKKTDGFLNFSQMTVQEILNRIRAMDPWPGTFCFIDDKRLKVFSAERIPFKIEAGILDTRMQTLSVGCINGSLRLTQVQIEGKKKCSDTEFLKGWRGQMKLTYSGESE